MNLPPRLFPGDLELGKRDDDHKPGSISPLAVVWSHGRHVMRRNLKKIILALALLVALYYLFRNVPTDLGPRTARKNNGYVTSTEEKYRAPKPKTITQSGAGENGRPQTTEDEEAGADSRHSFSGPIKYYDLAASLRAISNTGGSNLKNRNVLFSASSLKSAGILIPLACEMATLKRNHVHFSFVGRNDISIDLLKEVNGAKDCDIWFHDSRPDFLLQSSDYRMEVSASAGLGHINRFMNPQAVVIDGSGKEDEFFLKGFRESASALSRTLIQLPIDAEQNLRWITRLDSASLSKWNQVTIDVVVHAQTAASGSLLRLLGSLSKADYFRSPPPRLTIELPNKIDKPTQIFLENYKWPPSDQPVERNVNQLSLRHRISRSGLSPEENSIRFLETFWPSNHATSHLLILSPQTELSPLFYHYLKYFILEYKYSNNWAAEKRLMGISLDLPSTYLNDSASFDPPMITESAVSEPDSAVSFLWQAPNSNAALYFGDMWAELHSFVGQSLISQHKLATPTTVDTKDVSQTYPSWLGHILRLARSRGYHMLYSTLANQVSLATIHNELYRPPEEYNRFDAGNDDSPSEKVMDFTADPANHLSLQHIEKAVAKSSLLNILPHQGILPPLTDMPLLSWDGLPMSLTEIEKAAQSYSKIFRREIGGCGASESQRLRTEGTADDLFCL